MAVSGSFAKIFGPYNAHQLYVAYQETEVDENALTSRVVVSVYVKSLSASANIVASATKATTVTINGKNYTFTHAGLNLPPNGSVLMGSVTSDRIQHSSSDGTASVSISVTQEIGVNWQNGTSTWSVSHSKSNIALTKIARCSTVAVFAGSQIIGDDVHLLVTKQKSEYTHKIEYQWGSEFGTITEKTGDVLIVWPIPLSFNNMIPGKEVGGALLTITTYNGDTVVGTSQLGVQLTASPDAVPSISAITVTDPICNDAYGFLQNYCKAYIDTTASSKYGAAIAKYEVSCNGENLTGQKVLTSILKNYGEMKIDVKVTDTRGRTASRSTSINVTQYDLPKFESDFNRCTEEGEDYAGGDHIRIHGQVSAYSINESVVTLRVTSPEHDQTFTIESESFDVIFPCDTDHKTEVKMILSDGISTSEKTIVVESTVSWMDFGDDGVSVSFGGICQKLGQDTFRMPVEFEDVIFVGDYKVVYRPGDTWSETNYAAGGCVTTSGKDIDFSVATIPIMGNVRLKELGVCIRCVHGGYPYAKSKGSNPTYDQFTHTYLQIISDGKICIPNTVEFVHVYRKSGGFSVAIRLFNPLYRDANGTNTVTNNTPVSVRVKYTAECYLA